MESLQSLSTTLATIGFVYGLAQFVVYKRFPEKTAGIVAVSLLLPMAMTAVINADTFDDLLFLIVVTLLLAAACLRLLIGRDIFNHVAGNLIYDLLKAAVTAILHVTRVLLSLATKGIVSAATMIAPHLLRAANRLRLF